MDFGRVGAIGELRYGTADRAVSAEVALQREGVTRTWSIGGYHRLAVTDPALQPFSLAASLNAFVLGVDEAKFYRATGAELRVAPSADFTQWYDLRLYAEQQRDVDQHEDFNLRTKIVDSKHRFSANIEADAATQAGARLVLRRQMGANPNGLRSAVEMQWRAETGTFDFAQPSLTLRASAPLPGGLVMGVEGSSGTTLGTAPTQSLWYLGGSSTLRGYEYGVMPGASFWRGRAEIATGLPFARVAVFSDAGWAGPRDGFSTSRPLLSAGVGASLLDGVIRLDVARALRSPTGWRLHLYTGGIM
jgi:hypothetical protein